MCVSLTHGVTTHNWFAHYLWDIYGGFGHNGNIIQHTCSLPYLALSLHAQNWLSEPVFETLRTSEEKHVRESLAYGITTHNWFAHYLWDIYGGFGHNGSIIQRTLPSYTQPSCSKLAAWASF